MGPCGFHCEIHFIYEIRFLAKRKIGMRVILFYVLFFLSGHVWGLVWDYPVAGMQVGSAALPQGLQVLWWNVSAGIVGTPETAAAEKALNANLHEILVSSHAPDVIALTLFRPSLLEPSVKALLEERYLFRHFAPFDELAKYGIAVFSRVPLRLLRQEVLDFTPLELRSEAEREQYRRDWCHVVELCTRPFLAFELEWQGRRALFFPVHIYDVWRIYRNRHGWVKTALEVIYGDQNALWYQLQRFRQKVEQVRKERTDRPPVIIVGDFNIPRSVISLQAGVMGPAGIGTVFLQMPDSLERLRGNPSLAQSLDKGFQFLPGEEVFGAIITRGFRLVQRGLKWVFTGQTPTFPTRSSADSGWYPPMHIDHGFVDPQVEVQQARVLPLKGSTHYPFYLVVSWRP